VPIPNPDSLTLAAILQGLAADTAQALEADFAILVKRYPNLPWRDLLSALSIGNSAIAQHVILDSSNQNEGAALGTGPVLVGFRDSTVARMARTPDTFKGQNAVAFAGAPSVIAAWTPAAGKKFRLMGGIVSVSVAGVLTLADGAAGPIFCAVGLPANVSIALPPMVNGFLSAALNNVLQVGGLANAVLLNGMFFGTEE
jgi:hypothetical protein